MSYQVTDQEVLSAVQSILIEPINGGTVMGTNLWTTTELITYLNDRQRQILRETALVAQVIVVPVLAASDRVALPAHVIHVRHVTWVDSVDLHHHELERSDPWIHDHSNGQWDIDLGTPHAYHESALPTCQIELVPAPLNAGTLELIAITTMTDLSNSSIPCSIPDEFTPYLKYGILATCFKKPGPAQDLIRAAYCESRFQEGIELGVALMGHGGASHG
jgi:hypothetical protein